MQRAVSQSYAPFGSVTSKNSKKKKKKNQNQIVQPGPGSYDISLPLISPVVQTIRKKNNNIIVKLGHMGTPAFYGRQRFTELKKKLQLGPGQYQIQKKEKISPKKQRVNAAIRLKSIIQNKVENTPTFSEVKVVSFQQEIQMPKSREHLKQRIDKKNLKGLDWSKLTQKNTLDNRVKNNALGPGQYDIPQQRSKSVSLVPSPSFVSGSVRSFMDKIRYETNNDNKARQREYMNYKSKMMGPGSYEIQKQKKIEKKNKYQFFGSTQQRKI